MIKLSNFEKIKFTVNWGTVLIGWTGSSHFSKQLGREEVEQFAEKWIKESNLYNDLMADLIVNNSIDDEEISVILKQIVAKQTVNLNLEERKWRCVLLYALLEHIDSERENYINGLAELTDFWVSFGLPQDNPHIIQV